MSRLSTEMSLANNLARLIQVQILLKAAMSTDCTRSSNLVISSSRKSVPTYTDRHTSTHHRQTDTCLLS